MNSPHERARRASSATAAAAVLGVSFLQWTPASGAVAATGSDIPGVTVWDGAPPLAVVVAVSVATLLAAAFMPRARRVAAPTLAACAAGALGIAVRALIDGNTNLLAGPALGGLIIAGGALALAPRRPGWSVGPAATCVAAAALVVLVGQSAYGWHSGVPEAALFRRVYEYPTSVLFYEQVQPVSAWVCLAAAGMLLIVTTVRRRWVSWGGLIAMAAAAGVVIIEAARDGPGAHDALDRLPAAWLALAALATGAVGAWRIAR